MATTFVEADVEYCFVVLSDLVVCVFSIVDLVIKEVVFVVVVVVVVVFIDISVSLSLSPS